MRYIVALLPGIEINAQQYENRWVQSQADQAMRLAQSAQDQAWAAAH